MGLLNYLFRRAVAYEVIRGVQSVENHALSGRAAEKAYAEAVVHYCRLVQASFGAFSGDDAKAGLLAIERDVRMFQASLDAHPTPRRFARADVELRVALNHYVTAVSGAMANLDAGEEVEGRFVSELEEGQRHMAASQALMR